MATQDRISSALSGIGFRLQKLAACTLGLMLALCLAGLAGWLTFETVAAALGFLTGAGLMMGHLIVRTALGRADGGIDQVGLLDGGHPMTRTARTATVPTRPGTERDDAAPVHAVPESTSRRSGSPASWDEVDMTSAASFPAGDPPPWTLGRRRVGRGTAG